VSAQRFAGKVALVTGASSGLGTACARRLAADGALVYAVGRDESRLAELAAVSDRIVTESFDVADPAACAEAVRGCVERFGRLDVLINNAGRHVFRRTTEMTAADWQRDLDVNLGGAFHLSAAAIPHLLESHGNIVNVASIAALEGHPYSAAYSAAKHGLIGMTKAMAVEYVHSPIRINCVCPGGMDTPQVHGIEFPDGLDWSLVGRPAALRGLMSPVDVANVICFLASDEAAAVHGSVQVVDAGKLAG
jgi:NAD(P)-dependent dehydrogenase (short-subunit alcohol dehydrogenase family)